MMAKSSLEERIESIEIIDDNRELSSTIDNTIVSTYKLRLSQKIYIFFKSLVEWNIALIFAIVLTPLWIVLAISIKLDSKGPAIYKQKRVGKHNKSFNCCKWRSMTTDAPKNTATRDLVDSKAYITKVGSFIRKTSLDETAQIFNILTGKMSIIGYRPLVEPETDIRELRAKRGIYQLKPGITGWAQINGRDNVSIIEKVRKDEYYLRHVSLWLDIKIFFLTIKKVIVREGIKEGAEFESENAKA